MLLLFFVILCQPLILISVKNYCKIVDMKFSLKHLFNKISIILVEDIVLSYFLTNSDFPSINNSPIIILISIIITYMLRRVVRTYRLYQSLVHLYHPEDNDIYWLGSYYIGFYYNIVEFVIKLFICTAIIEFNYWNSFFYLLLQHIIEICLYYTKTIDTSNELFHITSNYIFKKLNE
jgi:hypothetical protein